MQGPSALDLRAPPCAVHRFNSEFRLLRGISFIFLVLKKWLGILFQSSSFLEMDAVKGQVNQEGTGNAIEAAAVAGAKKKPHNQVGGKLINKPSSSVSQGKENHSIRGQEPASVGGEERVGDNKAESI